MLLGSCIYPLPSWVVACIFVPSVAQLERSAAILRSWRWTIYLLSLPRLSLQTAPMRTPAPVNLSSLFLLHGWKKLLSLHQVSTPFSLVCLSADITDTTNDLTVPQSKSVPRKSRMDGFQGTIISIGTQTDSILDRFDLDDSLIPWLRVLTQTVWSSKWEASLRGSKFMLSYEQASKLTNAMMKDLGGVKNTTAQVCLNFLLISILTWNFCSCRHHPLAVSWYL